MGIQDRANPLPPNLYAPDPQDELAFLQIATKSARINLKYNDKVFLRLYSVN